MTASPVHDPLVERLRECERHPNSMISFTDTDCRALLARLAVPEGATGELVEAIGRALTRTADLAAGAGWTLEERSAMYADTGKLARAAAALAAKEREIVALRAPIKLALEEQRARIARFIDANLSCSTWWFVKAIQDGLDLDEPSAALAAARQPHSEGGGGGNG